MMLHGTQLQDRDGGPHLATPAKQVTPQVSTGRTWDPLSSYQGSRLG